MHTYIYIYIYIHMLQVITIRERGNLFLTSQYIFFWGLLLRTLENELAETLKRSLRFPDFDSQNSPFGVR